MKPERRDRGSDAAPTERVLRSVGLGAGPEFPADAYESIEQHLKPQTDPPSDAWREFAGAWNAIAYRYRSMVETSSEFEMLLQRDGAAPQPEGRYLQETAIFFFFVAALSVIESTCYALHAAGAHLNPAVFPMATEDDRRDATVGACIDLYAKAFPAAQITAKLAALKTSEELKDLRFARNTLAHRSAPPRLHRVGGETDGTSLWLGRTLEPEVTRAVSAWVTGTLIELLTAADALLGTVNKPKARERGA